MNAVDYWATSVRYHVYQSSGYGFCHLCGSGYGDGNDSYGMTLSSNRGSGDIVFLIEGEGAVSTCYSTQKVGDLVIGYQLVDES